MITRFIYANGRDTIAIDTTLSDADQLKEIWREYFNNKTFDTAQKFLTTMYDIIHIYDLRIDISEINIADAMTVIGAVSDCAILCMRSYESIYMNINQ